MSKPIQITVSERQIPAMIRDTVAKLLKLFRTYPNPIKGATTLNLEWNQTETGNYFLQLITSDGQLIHSRKLWIDAEAKVLSLEVPAVSAGNYFLRNNE